jgi:O-antigen ligase
MFVGMSAYWLWALLVVRSLFGGQTSRALLLVLPVVLIVANRFARAAVLAAIPAAAFGSVVLASWLSFRAYALIAAVAALGVLTRRWSPVPRFHSAVALLVAMVVGSAYTNTATVGGLSIRTLALYTVAGFAMMASAAVIRPAIDQVLLAIAATGALVGWAVLAGWFRLGNRSAPGELLRVFALGLNPNYLGLLVSLGALAACGLAVERKSWWVALLALPCVLSLPSLKSRTALLVLALGAVTIVASLPGRRRRRIVFVFAALGLVWALNTTLVSDVYRSVLGARADLNLAASDGLRRDVASFAFNQGLSHPLVGLGYGQFPAAAGTRFLVANPSAHDEYLRYFSELGVVGLGLLIAVVAEVGLALRRVAFRTTAGTVLAMYAVAMAAMEPLQSLPTSMGVMVLAGSVVGCSRPSPIEPTVTSGTYVWPPSNFRESRSEL